MTRLGSVLGGAASGIWMAKSALALQRAEWSSGVLFIAIALLLFVGALHRSGARS